jgi:cytochrome c oxidase subunit 2
VSNLAPAAGPQPEHRSEAIAVAAERRWAIVVGIIIALLVAMMIVTGLHWAAMPPSRVETIDVKTLHLSGEFVENNLGTVLSSDGKVTVRLVAQQYSFVPQCIVVPADVPVTFRATSTDAIHGFVVGTTNANTMLIPGFVATFTTTFRRTGEHLMPCHEYCGTGHEAMWARVQVLPAAEFLAKARGGERLSCVAR